MLSLDPAIASVAGLVVNGQHLSALDLLAIGLVVIASAGAATMAARGRRRLPSESCPPSPSVTVAS
jgi:inner membrane transporter RhtA